MSNDIQPFDSHDALAALRRESLDIYNRLHSIQEDIAFVNRVNDHYPHLPLLANLRCGAWYTDPALASSVPAYFKSTDGHTNNWGFNLRRANLHLLPLISEKHGILLVDSTRAGKRIPDALSKTVPIWCAVVNRAISIHRGRGGTDEQRSRWTTELYTPPGVVSAQEHHQIAQRLDAWAEALVNSSFDIPLDLPAPLRPFWITPATTSFPVLDPQHGSSAFLPVVCVSASKQVEAGTERREGGYAYVQGSGDDHELWGMGLTPQLFWQHRKVLTSSPRADLESLIKQILNTSSPSPTSLSAPFDLVPPLTPIKKINGRIYLGSFYPSDLCAILGALRSNTSRSPKSSYIILDFSHTLDAYPDPDASPSSTRRILHIQAAPKLKLKPDAHFLQSILPVAIPFIQSHISSSDSSHTVCILEGCGNDMGTRLDMSVGIALVAIQMLFDDTGELRAGGAGMSVDKKTIRTRLEWIIESEPRANPSRAILKRVNEFFLTPPTYLTSY